MKYSAYVIMTGNSYVMDKNGNVTINPLKGYLYSSERLALNRLHKLQRRNPGTYIVNKITLQLTKE